MKRVHAFRLGKKPIAFLDSIAEKRSMRTGKKVTRADVLREIIEASADVSDAALLTMLSNTKGDAK